MNGTTSLMFKYPALLFLLVCWTWNSVDANTQGQASRGRTETPLRNMIGNIKDKNAPDGCGCYFSFPSEDHKRFPRYVFTADLEEKSAWMNIDGRDVRLKLVQSTGTHEREKIGSKLTRTYVAGEIKVRAVYVTTGICRPDDESCESTDYRASFVVKKGLRQQTIRLKGGCGC
jgi:hypothetical protein